MPLPVLLVGDVAFLALLWVVLLPRKQAAPPKRERVKNTSTQKELTAATVSGRPHCGRKGTKARSVSLLNSEALPPTCGSSEPPRISVIGRTPMTRATVEDLTAGLV